MGKTVSLELITVTIGAAATQVTSTPTNTTMVEFFSESGNDSAYIGDSDVDNTWIPRAGGSTTTFSIEKIPGEATHFDLSKFYIAGTQNDVVRVQYLKND